MHLELIVLTHTGLLLTPTSIVSDVCLFPANRLWSEETQTQPCAFTVEQFGSEPNLILKKEEMNAKPNSSSLFP